MDALEFGVDKLGPQNSRGDEAREQAPDHHGVVMADEGAATGGLVESVRGDRGGYTERSAFGVFRCGCGCDGGCGGGSGRGSRGGRVRH